MFDRLSDLPRLSRRDWLKLASAGVVGYSLSGWLERMADAAAGHPARKRACILLWMSGGPSQMDTFDLKPGHENGGPFKEIRTSAPGLRISEHLPKVAKFGDRMAVVRSMSTKEGDHGRATFLMRTGYLPLNSIAYPSFGSVVSKELGKDDSPLPNYVSIAPYRLFSPAAFDSGFLGAQHAPLIIADNSGAGFVTGTPGSEGYEEALKVKDLKPAGKVDKGHLDSRFDLLRGLEKDFGSDRPDAPPRSHKSAYERAVRLMKTAASKAFDLSAEKEKVRDAYGRNLFGQGCLLARRLVERGVPFVEVTLGGLNGGAFGWDTHGDNFNQVRQLSELLDPAWSALMGDLKERGLLDSTLIVWMGEFGRTPKITGTGRDHYPNAWSVVLAGGGIKGGQAVGKTSKDGTTIEERPVGVPDLMGTIAKALGIDPEKQNMSPGGRPIRVADKTGKPIKEIVG
jgi:hypothetical protein